MINFQEANIQKVFVFPPPAIIKESFSNIVPPPNSRANDGQDDVTDCGYESKTTVAKNPSYVVFGQANSKKDISHQIEVKLTIISFKINKIIDLGYFY